MFYIRNFNIKSRFSSLDHLLYFRGFNLPNDAEKMRAFLDENPTTTLIRKNNNHRGIQLSFYNLTNFNRVQKKNHRYDLVTITVESRYNNICCLIFYVLRRFLAADRFVNLLHKDFAIALYLCHNNIFGLLL